jgi:hypothetical protein
VLGRVDRSRSGGAPRRNAGAGGGGEEDAASTPTENTLQIVVDRIVPIEGVPLMPGRLWLLVDGQRLNGSGESVLRTVASLIHGAAAGMGAAPDKTTMFPLGIAIDNAGQRVGLEAPGQLRIAPTPELIGQIARELGENCIRVVGGVSLDSGKERPDRSKWKKKE